MQPVFSLSLCLSVVRTQQLEEALHFHEYTRESSELEEWIAQQCQIAASEDYGNNYEHKSALDGMPF
uniref:Uncharacterized protein n=1 Tax=Erpetoichthys calabaricus TaxID=27687 RepID=A0A8C4TB27_ERPCA